ncbi:HNH endonuclease [Pseudomonas sp. AB12(2023)]|uniref:HNH endonuclease n=1 Tax=Pseudomonas sp. AB12(2023) TaxID=3048597 RepID=UPI002B22571E|nr:HNH endonuclease [Pseudomonas sp. AB12(2023)]MEB0221338.1 HNH endonuclease [Pseudomonas sp. AB12(2023)]
MTDESTYDQLANSDERALPKHGLGAGFENGLLPPLYFSTKSLIWGDKSGSATEPTGKEFKTSNVKKLTLEASGYRCMYCGFHSGHNEVHNLSDNHQDTRLVNFGVIDQLCHGWKHLGELGKGNGVIAYLPGLSSQDVNHLQRTIMVALQSDDDLAKKDAKILLNWLGSHMSYVEEAWGTNVPEVFAKALLKQSEEDKERREFVFEGLAVIFNPRSYSELATLWSQDYGFSYPVGKWTETYFSVINPPA